MPATEEFLKFLCVFRKLRQGGYQYFYNERGNYSVQTEYLAAKGFRSWKHLYEPTAETLEGFIACQMRPPVRLLSGKDGTTLYAEADYCTPFDAWKFALRHQPGECPIPDWVYVRELRSESVRLLPEWARHHIVYGGVASCGSGQAIVALNDSCVYQDAGALWAYAKSVVIQRGATSCTRLHNYSTGFIEHHVSAYDHSRVELAYTGSARAFGSATVVLRPGPSGQLGNVIAYGSNVAVFMARPNVGGGSESRSKIGDLVPIECERRAEERPYAARNDINMPFGCPVD